MRYTQSFVLFLFSCVVLPSIETFAEPDILEEVVVDQVWSGHRVGFDLLTHQNKQYTAYYNEKRQMVIAVRDTSESNWAYTILPSTIGWDSHNYITMAFDRDGYLHVSGNMHVDPLVYFRSEKPYDISSFNAVHHMTGKQETRVTYPRFLYNAMGDLLFMYRDGSSGNGLRYINQYHEDKQAWTRYLDEPLLDGKQHNMNAYPTSIKKGDDGWFHLVWMWRDTPDCRSNHDISHARSRDLIHWETINGESLVLPITPDHKNTVVDPVPAYEGLINMGFGYGFDQQKRILIQYHKYDEQGNSQVYIARWENDQWVQYPISNWNYRWEFEGGGSVPCDVRGNSVKKHADGKLIQSWSHVKFGSGTWVLDAGNLSRIGEIDLPKTIPSALRNVESEFKGMQVNWQSGRGTNPEKNTWYMMRWETLPPNRDRAREGALPEPSVLKVYQFKN